MEGKGVLPIPDPDAWVRSMEVKLAAGCIGGDELPGRSSIATEVAGTSSLSEDLSSDSTAVEDECGYVTAGAGLKREIGVPGEGDGRRKYTVCLPGTEGCLDDKMRTGSESWDHCPVEVDDGPDLRELYYLNVELNHQKCVIYNVKLLMELGVQSIGEVTEAIREKLEKHSVSVSEDLDASCTQTLEYSQVMMTPAFAKWNLFEMDRVGVDNIAGKFMEVIHDFFKIDPSLTLLKDIHAEIEKEFDANLEEYKAKLDMLKEKSPC